VGPDLAILFALVGRFCARLARPAPSWRQVVLPASVALAGVIVLAALPGRFVWGPFNRFGAYMYPRVGQNLPKMPPDLLTIAQRMSTDTGTGKRTILCGEEIASYLIPWSDRFGYVVIRTFYLPGNGLDPSQHDASARYFLTLMAQGGRFAEQLYNARLLLGNTRLIPTDLVDGTRPVPRPASDNLPRLDDVPRLLDQYRVDYVITSLPVWLTGPAKYQFGRRLMADRDELLRQLGFREVYSGREHSLWAR
jgi:hypothetical protein